MNRREFIKSGTAAAVAISVTSSIGVAEQRRGIIHYPDPWIEVID